MAKTVSIIITTYKRELSLFEPALKSVLAQTYAPVEVLVIDDNPTDNEYSKAVQELLKSKYPTVLYYKMPQNSGVSRARNEGITRSSGELIAFMDDDDIIMPEKTSIQVKQFDDSKVGLVYCKGYSFENGDTEKLTPVYHCKNYKKECSYAEILGGNHVGSIYYMFRRVCAEQCGLFDITLPSREDYDFIIQIARGGWKLVGVEDFLFMRRFHSASQLSAAYCDITAGYKAIYRKYKPDYKKYKASRIRMYFLIGQNSKKAGKPLGKLLYALKAFLVSPSLFKKALYESKQSKNGCV